MFDTSINQTHIFLYFWLINICMTIPLQNRLKKRMHVEIASLQDELVELLYTIDPNLVLHGGTCVWRCYGGNRFSEDLDFYCSDPGRIETKLAEKAVERNLAIDKFKKTKNLVFCKISGNGTIVRIEMNFAVAKTPVVRPYERVDGTFMEIFTLSEEELLIEKMNAYNNRRFVRDLYDIHLLSNYASADKKTMNEFLKGIEPPIDEKNLKTLVYSGAVPDFRQMVEAMKRRFK